MLLLFSNRSNAQQNIAPLATVSNSDPYQWNMINDLNFGTCGNQQAFVWTADPPSSTPGVDWMQWDFSRPRSFDSLIIHHAETSGRFLTGALVQYWDGNSWVNHSTFSNLSQANCVNRVYIGKVTTDRFRLTALEMNGSGQTSNPNFREIEIIEAPSGYNDALVFSLDSLDAFCAGNQDIYATIGNFGLNQIDSVDIHWEVNGVPQPTIHYTQLLDTVYGNFPYKVSILLGNVFLNSGSSIIKIFTSLPNGIADTITYNDTLIKVVQTATPPTGLIAFNGTTTSMDFEVFGLAGDVDYEYGLAGFTLGTGTVGSSTTNPFTINTLQPSNHYDIYVRSNCGGSDISTWVGPFGFCTDYTAPFYNDMELEDLGAPPVCWNTKMTNTNAFIEVQAYTGTSAPYAGSRALYIYSSNSTATDTIMAITPELFDLPVGDKQVRFVANSDGPSSQLIIGTMASPDASVLNPIDTIFFPVSYKYQEVIVQFNAASGYNGTDQYIYLQHSLGTTYQYIRIDNFHYEEIPSCLKPLNATLHLDNLTSSSVDFSWLEQGTATEWEIKYDTVGFSPDTGNSLIVTTNPYNITGLSPNSTYDFYVRSICGRSDSSYWAGPITVHTPCLPSTASYYNDFENEPTAELPNCWSSIKTVYYSEVFVNSYTGTAAPFAGNKALYLYGYNGVPGTDKVMAISPGFSDLSAYDKQIRFFANSDNSASALIIGTMASPIDTSLNPLDTIYFAQEDTYEEVIFKFDAASGYNGTDQYIYFAHSLGGTYQYIRIDEFHYEPIPTCSKPPYASLAIDSLTATSVRFSWTEPAAATTWEIEYGTPGFTAGTGISTIVTSNPFTITGLSPNTVYQMYVRSVCGRGDSSYWSGPFNFETPCAPSTAAYYNNFENETNSQMPGCWRVFNTYYGSYAYVNNFTGISEPYAGSKALYMYSSNAVQGLDKLLSISPGFSDLTAYDKQIRFFANSSDPASSLIIGTMPSPIDTGNMHPLDTIVFANADVYEEIIFLFDAASGYNGTDQYIYLQHNLGNTYDYLRIDEFHYETIPTCKKPNNLSVSNIGTSSVDLNWFEKNVATDWHIQYGPSGFALGTGIDSAATTNPFTITGLQPATYYEFYVRSLCGRGDTSFWTGPFEFVTNCPASYPAPYFNDFEEDRLNLMPICWDSIASVANSWVEVKDYSPSYSGSQALFLYGYNGVPNTDTIMAITPRFGGLTANNKRISFYASSDNVAVKLIVGTMSSPSSTVLNVIDTITFTTPGIYQKVELKFNASTGYNGTDEYIFLMHNLGSSYQYIRIDDFSYFEVPPIDAAITDLIAPENNVDKCFTASENLSVALTSRGSDPLDFTVDTAIVTVNVTGAHTQSYTYTVDDNSLNGGVSLIEDNTIQLPIGTVDMSNSGTYYFDISLSMTNDGKVTNNSYKDTIVANLGGNVVGPDSICLGDSVNLFLENYVGSIQWQSGTGGTFSDIPGADSTNVIVKPNSIMSYRAVVCGSYYSDTLTMEPVSVSQPIAFDSLLVVSCGDTGTVALVVTSNTANVSFEWFDSPTGGTALTPGGNITSISPNGDTLYFRSSSTDSSKPVIDTFYVQEVLHTSSIGANSLLITEAELSAPDALEIQNVTAQPIDVTGWTVAVSDNTIDINTVQSFLSLNGTMMPGETKAWTEGVNWATSNIAWNPTTEGWIIILDDRGKIVDAVFFNWAATDIQSLSTVINGFPVSLGNEWVGDGIDGSTQTSGITIQRIGLDDNDDLSDFTIKTGSFGTTNRGLQLPFPGGACISSRDTAIATIDCIVGMQDLGKAFPNISLHPNPSKGIFHIVGSQVREDVQISIYNTNGKMVYRSANKFSNDFDTRIDISDFAKGLYFIKLQSKSSMEMKKIVLQ